MRRHPDLSRAAFCAAERKDAAFHIRERIGLKPNKNGITGVMPFSSATFLLLTS
jgi:hypothetical protein